VEENAMTIRLQNGSRVCIVGGGPAGSFSAMHLIRLAQEQGLSLDVLIFEARDPTGPGRESCKGCAGILSADLVNALPAMGITLPPQVIQSELNAYVVHVAGQVTSIEQPNPQRHILSVYRGSGPRLGEGDDIVGLDGFLLAQACARGARLIPSRVREVEWGERPIVQTARERFPADLLVLATGVNSRPPLAPAFGYQEPATAQMAQDEIPIPEHWPAYKVAGFFGQPSGVNFGAVVPKGRYLNVSLLPQKEQGIETLASFYRTQAQALGRFFPVQPASLCSCTSRIAVHPAKNYFGDRWVAVGDAAVSRLFKDGIHSAFRTTRAAMRAAVEIGIAREDFAQAYAPFCRRLARDNQYGEILFNVSLLAMKSPLFARAVIECVRAEAGLPFQQRIYSRVLWGMLTGDDEYRDLFGLCLRPRGWFRLASQLMQTVVHRPPLPS
jgi:flavin-dependent dehydrogenase